MMTEREKEIRERLASARAIQASGTTVTVQALEELLAEIDRLLVLNGLLEDQIPALKERWQKSAASFKVTEKERDALRAENEKLKSQGITNCANGHVFISPPVICPDCDNQTLRERVASLFEVLKHGDEKHQAWLRETIRKHFKDEKK